MTCWCPVDDMKFREFHGWIPTKPALMVATFASVPECSRRIPSDAVDLIQKWHAIARHEPQHGETDIGAVDDQ